MADEALSDDEMRETTESFADAYQTHASSIYNFLFWRTNDTQLAEELTSTTFQKAWASRKSFRGGSIQSWLYRIARNVLIDYWRKKKELSIDSFANAQEDSLPGADEVLDRQLQLDRLQKALDTLPPDMRKIITLRFIEGLSCKAVSQKLGMSDGNVRIIQHRALRKLREHL